MVADTLFDDEFLKKLEYLYIVSKKVFAGRLRAKRRTKIVGSGIEFADYRDYSPGDDLRYLDWSLLARTERLLIRLFEEEEDLYLYFLVDFSQSMRLGNAAKLDYAKRLTAALAYIGLSNMDRVSVVPFAEKILDRLPPSRGKRQIFRVFDFLERPYDQAKQTDIRSTFKKFVSQNKRRGIAVAISDFYDLDGFAEGLDYLRFNKFEPLVCHVYSEADLNPDLFGDVELVDCETGRRVSLTITRDMLKTYRKVHEELIETVEEYCRHKNLLYFRAPIQIPFDELVLKVLRSGGFIR